MLHPLFSTIVHRPDLVFDHLSAYAALARQEASSAGAEFVVRIVAWVMALVAAMIFLLFTGMAIMLGFINDRFHWALVAVPGTALAVSIIAVFMAKKPLRSEHFPELKAQVESDAQALRAAV